METTAAITTATVVAAAGVSTASAELGARTDVPLPSFGGGRGWFRQRVPKAGVVVSPSVGGHPVSPATLSPSSHMEGIRLRCASYGRGVLRLPRSLPQTLRETLAQSVASTGLILHSPTRLGGAPETRCDNRPPKCKLRGR